MGPSPLEQLFNPKSIAVFGASDSGRNVGSKLFANLANGGFHGKIAPVNPKYKLVGGIKCVSTIDKVSFDIDLAVIATPAKSVPEILMQCGEVGIQNAIILSAGFGETGPDGERLTAEILDVARRNGIRFMGPNCVGLVRPWIGMNATFLNSETPKGRLAVVSQSGALCSAISDWAGPHHLGFSAIVSLGNSANIDFGDVVHFLSTDPNTDAILLYAEGIRDARTFISSLRAASALKPVIVLKAGRHSFSSEAAHTHTGALIGSDDVFDAALERAGAVRVETFGQLFAAAEILSTNQRSAGNRLGIITNGGGAGVLAADRAGDLHIDLPALSEQTIKSLNSKLFPYWSKSNPVDILGDAPPESFGAAVAAGLKDPSFDGILVMLTPQAMTDATGAAKAVINAIPARTKKPVLTCWMGQTSVSEARELLNKNGLPVFSTPEKAIEAFSYLTKHHLNQKLSLETPAPLFDFEPPDLDGAKMIIASALSEGRSMLSDIESKAILSAFHIPVNITLEAGSSAKALIAAETVGFPVAMKINSPDISHKSDVSGVKVNVMNAADVKVAYREIIESAKAARPDASISGVTVEPMAHVEDARELVIGASRDPVFGPSILFGAGGEMVEILRDSAVALPPLNAILADRLIKRTKVSRLLDAFRDRPAVDQNAVINVLLRVSDLVIELSEVTELDINPLFAGPNGVIAVDARLGISRPPARAGRYDHLAIAPYPRHLVQEGHLADGTPLTIRPIRPDDAESEKAFVRDLSQQAKRFRFMGTLNQLSPKMLARFTQIDYGREMALVAVTEENGEFIQQGVARYVINPDNTSCEFAIVVSDNHQHQGIGTRLMKALMDAARHHNIDVIEGTVLSDNTAMLHLMTELGFSKKRSTEERDIYLVERWL